MCATCVHVCLVPTKIIGSPRTGAADGCEPPHGGWEPHLGPLQEQRASLTTEPPLQVKAPSSEG